MGRKLSLNYQVQKILSSKLAIGEKRHQAKDDGTAKDKIFSYKTYHNYLESANRFVNYCKENYNCKTLNDCEKHVNDYIQAKRNDKVSAYTQKSYLSALGKLYGKSYFDKVETDARSRTQITRSRQETNNEKLFNNSKQKNELEHFCKNTGLRRRELAQIKGSSLAKKDGKYGINVSNGKGGKERFVPILNQDKSVIEKMLSTPQNEKVFKSIHSKAPIHQFRGYYAREYYNQIARDTNTLSYKEIYYCRSDMKGETYDKLALREVSEALGHNRENVIVSHYLR